MLVRENFKQRKWLSPLSKSGGFTLIEVILVIIFLGIAFVASLELMSTSLTNSMSLQIHTTAANLANKKMEAIFIDKKSKGYDYVVIENYPNEVNPDGTNGFNRYVTIVRQSTHKEVEVKVTHAGIPDYVLTAFLTNY